MHIRHAALLSLVLSLALFDFRPSSSAQVVPTLTPTPSAVTGYELALLASTTVELGGELRGHGTAYRVLGLATLDPLHNGRVVARLVRAVTDANGGQRSEVVRETAVRTDALGLFTFALPVPEEAMLAPRLEVVVDGAGVAARTFSFGLSLSSPLRLDLRSDRVLYEAGETMHLWTRTSHRSSGAPMPDRSVRVVVTAPNGATVVDRVLPARASGGAFLDVPLEAGAPEGGYAIRANVVGSLASASSALNVRVGRRTVERILVNATLERDLIAPGGRLRGVVAVRTPSGTPIVGASVTVRPSADAEPIVLTTDAAGDARFDATAPAFLPGDTATNTLDVRVVHAAHGTLRIGVPYIVTRVMRLFSIVPEHGGVVPETNEIAYVLVEDPKGNPAPAGTPLRVQGPAVRGGSHRALTDRHGLIEVPLRLPMGIASRVPSGSRGCAANTVGTFVDVTVDDPSQYSTRLCLTVADEANVAIFTDAPVIAPGANVDVRVERRPRARGRAVLVEALVRHQPVAAVWIAPGSDRATITVPPTALGVVTLRARTLTSERERARLDERGLAAFGAGSSVMLLVRPRDAFDLTVAGERDVFSIGERAGIRLQTAPNAGRGWATLVARDLTAHGGESPWEMPWFLERSFDAAVVSPGTPEAERLLRSAFAAAVTTDLKAVTPEPLDPAPWSPRMASGPRHDLRDPIFLRDEKLRRGLGPVMQQIEAVLQNAERNDPILAQIVTRQGGRSAFHPDAIRRLLTGERLHPGYAQTLGGEPMTIAMLTAADPSFTFDNVARRATRAKLVGLLSGLARFTDLDNPTAARLLATEPPERWLARVVELELAPPSSLIDAWGRPFAFRRVGAERSALVVSERAPDFELSSAGPDGVFGNTDDVRTPFTRAVPEGTPYAVSSGEDNLMRALSLLAPGPNVLQAMFEAYERVSIEVAEEAQGDAVSAASSEMAADMGGLEVNGTGLGGGGTGEGTIGLGSMGTIGRGGGRGSGSGYGMASAAAPMAAPAREQDMERGEESSRRLRAVNGPDDAAEERLEMHSGVSRLASLAERVRERFPATLHFIGELELDASGTTRVEIPLADALTSYRIEAIAWTPSGWVSSGGGEIRVDQEAMVDAPVPPFATSGDHVRVPVRVSNRTDRPLTARIEIAAEGGVTIEAPAPRTVEIPPRDAVESVMEIVMRDPGEGHLVVRAVRAEGGAPLDAVRRPLSIVADARRVSSSVERVVVGRQTLELDVPESATERGPGELRLSVGANLFGDPAEWGKRSGMHAAAAAWTLALARREIPDELRYPSRALAEQMGREDEEYRVAVVQQSLEEAASLFSVALDDEAIDDGQLIAWLTAISHVFSASAISPGHYDPQALRTRAGVLIGLAPAFRAPRAMRNGPVRAELTRIVQRLRTEVASASATIPEPGTDTFLSALALGLVRGNGEDPRARELLRRAQRDVLILGDERWIEAHDTYGETLSRVAPTALAAFAHAAVGDREIGLSFLRGLVGLSRRTEEWSAESLAFAGAAAWAATGGHIDGAPRVQLDGRDVEVRMNAGVVVATLPGVARGGRHRVDIFLDEGDLALAQLELRYAVPWALAPRQRAPIEVSIDGEIGARDARSGLRLVVRNRGPRVLVAPVVEVDLPAGAELDEPSRQALGQLLARPPSMEGRTLLLALRPMAPGGYLRISLPLRWSVGGGLRGLGLSAFDTVVGDDGTGRPTSVVPSRELTIADEGAEPEAPDNEASPPPTPPPPPPIPFEPLRPLAMVTL